jgi:hypothetical protein
VYDEERDPDRGRLPYWARVLTLGLFALAIGVALFPAVTGFATGPDGDHTCIAVVDAWHRGPAKPSQATIDEMNAAAPAWPTPAELSKPAVQARVRKELAAYQARPDVQQMDAYYAWTQQGGACVHESRHRLVISGAGLGAVLVALLVFGVVRHAKRPPRRAAVESQLV